MKRLTGLWTLAVLALVVASPARAVSLATLLDGGSITVGDKVFSDWTLLGQGLIDTTFTYTLDDIDVVGLDDGGDYGLRFTLRDGFVLSGDNLIDLYFGYTASVAPGSDMAIKDVSFGFDSGGWSGDGFTAGLEDVYSVAGDWLGGIDLEAGTARFVISGNAVFAPQSSVLVTKNLVWYGFGDGDSTYLNSFTQRFSQVAVAPEPGTLALLTLGLLGLGFGRRRRT